MGEMRGTVRFVQDDKSLCGGGLEMSAGYGDGGYGGGFGAEDSWA